MPYWNFEYTKAVIYTVVKVGGGIGVTHLRLNQPPVFSSVPKLFSEYSLQSKNISVILIANVFWPKTANTSPN